MRADAAQAMVARCRVEPMAVGSGRDVPAGDLPEALRLFRGFIAAIKHNGLRKIAPLTLRLLRACNAEILFFAEIAPAYLELRRKVALPPAALFDHFERSLRTYLPRMGAQARPLVEAVLRHEASIWRAATAPRDEPVSAGPRLAPAARIEPYELDVLGLSAELARGPCDAPPAAERRRQFIFYQPEGEITRIFEIDALSACVLALVDGRPLEAVCGDAAKASGFATTAMVASLIEDAASRGMVVPGAAASALA